MAEWIKLSTAMFDNRKIKQIEVAPAGKQMLLLWVRLICLAGAINDGGLIYIAEGVPYTLKGLSLELNESESMVKKALDLFQAYNMISYDDNNCLLLNGWEKHQNADALDRIKEQTRKKVRRYRERKSNITCNADVTQCNVTETLPKRYGNATVTQENKNKNKEKDIYTPISILSLKDEVDSKSNRVNNNTLYGSSNILVSQDNNNIYNNMPDVIALYESKIAPLTANIAEQLKDLLEEYGEERVRNGIEAAARNNAKSIRYIAACVANPIAERKKNDVKKAAEEAYEKMLAAELKGDDIIGF